MQLLNSAALISIPSNDLAAQIGTDSSPSKGSKLHDAAQGFEALMMQELLKITRETSSDGWLGSGDSSGDDSAMDLAQSQLARGLASHGGFGLAKIIEDRLAPAIDRRSQTTQNPSLNQSH